MSKSLGNFTTIRALLDSGVSPMTLRLFTLQAHYRKPLDFTAEALDAAATGWKGLNAALALVSSAGAAAAATPPAQLPQELAAARQRFAAAMDDDLNTSAALAVLFELAKPLRSLANRIERGDGAAAAEAATPALVAQGQLLLELAGVLGLQHELATESAPTGSGSRAPSPSDAEIQAQITARQAAKAAKDFAAADSIRTALQAQGIELIDKPGGITEWLRV
jgi:cysteinyl-tRNA synthetase